MKKLSLFLCLLVLIFCSAQAFAVPIPIGGPVLGPGDGLNSKWVNTLGGIYRPDYVSEAIDALSWDSSNPGYVGEVNQVVNAINFNDSSQLLYPDDDFAVRYYGFINISESNKGYYDFRTLHDDGFRLNIGGETISIYDGNTAPRDTFSYNIDFTTAGLYAFEFIGWEQGGQFENHLYWREYGTSSWSFITSEVLFTYNPIPEPATMLLLGSGLAGLAGFRRKKFKK